MVKQLINIFKIRREERGIAVVTLVIQIALHALLISKYYTQFTVLTKNYWNLFLGKFCLSGFDPITYYVVSDWEARYNVYRHPLLAFFMYIPYIINKALMNVTGINLVQFIVAAILLFCSFYSFIFIHRIFRDIIRLKRFDSALLSFLLFSFAFVMLSAIAPDHFIMSMMMLLLTLYISGIMMKEGKNMKKWQTILLFIFTAGISLNNGLKTFTSALFVNRKKFFHPNFLLCAVILPTFLMWGFCRYEYKTFVWEGEQARHEIRAKKKAQEERIKHINDSIAQVKGTIAQVPQKKETKKPKQAKQGRPIMKGEFMRWTDISTSRWESAVENLFGESIQLHQEYLLKDEFRTRPMIVRYNWFLNYIIEGIIVLLFAAGIWYGRKSRFLWMCMSFFGLDMVLHIGLGFGLNEVYIMSAHWIYVIPIAIGYILKSHSEKWIRAAIVLLTAYLYIYNISLITTFLIQ